jgi:putative endonuclease
MDKLADLPAYGGRTMVTVYVIEGRNRFRYVGITKNLTDRLERHNSSRSKSTRPYAPFKLLLTEDYENYKEARKREKILNSGVGRVF